MAVMMAGWSYIGTSINQFLMETFSQEFMASSSQSWH
jgi:hypothetical protein